MAATTVTHTGQTENVPRPAATTNPNVTKNAGNLTEADKSATAQLTGTLNMYGLGSLGTWAWQKYLSGESIDQIFIDMRETAQYKARFPAMEALAKQGSAITENQYVQLETTFKQLYHAAGLPATFYDTPDDFTKLIAGQVSPTELKSRLDMATTAAYTAPVETRQALQDLYGVTPGELTAYWLDPDKALPLLQQRYAAASASGTAQIAGYGALNQSEAERVAQIGLTPEATSAGFGKLVTEGQLFNNLPGEQGTQIDRNAQIDALVGDQAVQNAIEARARQRVAAFGDTGRTYAATQKGVTGLTEANEPQ